MWAMHSDFSLDWVEGPLDLPLDPRLAKFFRRYSELVDRPETNLGARCRCTVSQGQNPTRARRVIDLTRLNSRMNSLKPLDKSNPCLNMTFFKLTAIST